MKHSIIRNGDIIGSCGFAASMSYGKDISRMTEGDIEQYVKRIWDKHTNISEHFVATIKFDDIPRIATLLIGFQRYGFTMTEFSQRRRIPNTDYMEYHELISNGIAPEDARKVLPIDTNSQCVITMNREAAKNIARILAKYNGVFDFPYNQIIDALESVFSFSLDDKNPLFCPEFFGILDGKSEYKAEKIGDSQYIFILPLYSFHQLIRHRLLRIKCWSIYKNGEKITNASIVNTTIEVRDIDLLKATRTGKDTQEPLRSLIQSL